jgi:hypothetical protein
MEREEYNLGVQHLNPASRPANKKTYLTTKTTIIQQRAEQSQELKKTENNNTLESPRKRQEEDGMCSSKDICMPS